MIRWWLFLAIAGLFAFVFLAFRLRAVKRMSGALNLALDYKQNPLRYMSALLIFGFILSSFNLASFIFYYDINRLPLYITLYNSLDLITWLVFTYAILKLRRRMNIASIAIASRGILIAASIIRNLITSRDVAAGVEQEIEWIAIIDVAFYIAVGMLLYMRKFPKVFKLVALAYFALSVITVIVAIVREAHMYNIAPYIVSVAVPTLIYNFVIMRIYV